jgi:integrase/recombinase XerD
VIMPRFYALERLPCSLPWETIQRVLNSVDETTARGRRDQAILLMLVTYGVRPGEISKLRLQDIDWRHENIQFRRCKNGRPLSFPLTQTVGESVIAYLEDGRPRTSSGELFIRMTAPHVAFSGGSSVGHLVGKYLRKAGIESPHMGAYVIRHSLAVHLLRQRHPLKTITDVLGHRDPAVAYHYTKLGLDDLHGVALDAKEVLP